VCRRRDRSPLAHFLADGFAGLTALGEPITKALQMINPSGHGVKSITFGEQFVIAQSLACRIKLVDMFANTLRAIGLCGVGYQIVVQPTI
jgi:hypothetical protein